MFLGVTDIFKIGIGPSSSHTTGPMVAAGRFAAQIPADAPAEARLSVRLYGSLAFTGIGHGSDRAIILGLMGETPEAIEPGRIDGMIAAQARDGRIAHAGGALRFCPQEDLVFDKGPALPGHSNGMRFQLLGPSGEALLDEVYYSIGGGFVLSGAEMAERQSPGVDVSDVNFPYPFASANEMLAMGKASGLSIAGMKRANECARPGGERLDAHLDAIWAAMQACMARGLEQQGELGGGLGVRRRARGIYRDLVRERRNNACLPHHVMDWLSVFALAVNEENAAGGRVVTAPTNGAAGIIPAVLRYYLELCSGARPEDAREFLLTAAAIGGLIKHNASISGAEVGCQGEVGSASAMAAAGLCAVMGGSNEQIENAAEIALEHHLGMTCDPIGGLVQVPCIERNALGAVKAVTAMGLALKGSGAHYVSLDRCVETMRQTGRDMSDKYKETSLGGLAVSVVDC